MKNSGEKIFIAGASGMVGSAILRILRKRKLKNKKEIDPVLIPTRKELDLTNSVDVDQWFKKNQPRIVIIAAAKVGGIYANFSKPADFILENIKIQTNLIESSFRNKVKRLLFLGSSCIYPKYSRQPIKEEYLLQGGLESTNEAYAIAKISGIKLCESFRTQYGFDAISLMPTNLYGPNDNYDENNSHVMASLIKKICNAKKNSEKSVICWGSGDPLREFMHVDDLARGVLFALENWFPDDIKSPRYNNGMPLNFLNIGSGEEISIRDLSKLICRLVKYQGEIIWDSSKPDGTPRKLLDSSRIKSLGWKTKITLEDGIKKTISEFL